MYCVRVQVLSDPQKRAIYDQYGEEGLKEGGGGGFGPGGGGFHYQPRAAQDIFEEVGASRSIEGPQSDKT